jgi:hypothetical protein
MRLVDENPVGNPRAIPAMTTHGRTAWSEAILGSVAFQVIRGAKRPVILYCPLVKDAAPPKKVTTLAVALDVYFAIAYQSIVVEQAHPFP